MTRHVFGDDTRLMVFEEQFDNPKDCVHFHTIFGAKGPFDRYLYSYTVLSVLLQISFTRYKKHGSCPGKTHASCSRNGPQLPHCLRK